MINTTEQLERREIPRNALRLPATLFKLTDDRPVAGQPFPVRLLARSGQSFYHWFWGENYHDFAGMTHKPRIALDYLHFDDEIIGYADKFRIDDQGLWLEGALVPFSPHDRASEIIAKADAGVPYEASIAFDIARIEELAPGATADVNNQTITGPATIFRHWELVGCAVCPHGYDPHTRTETDFMRTVQYSKKGTPMKLNAPPADPPTETPVETPAPLPAETPADPLTQLRAEAKRFTDAFGPEGAQWYLEGKTFDECALARIAALQTENAALKQRLSAPAPTGETTPATFSAPPTDQQTGKPATGKRLAGDIVRTK